MKRSSTKLRKRGATIVTRKGQITLPAEIRRAMGLNRGARVVVVLDGKEARLIPARGVVEQTAGVFKPGDPSLTAEQLREAAELAIAEEAEH